jgi:hypothetical protein
MQTAVARTAPMVYNGGLPPRKAIHMRYFRALAASVLVLTVVTPALAQAPAPAPNADNQQTIAKLQNFGTMVAFTNLASGAVRLIVVLDPVSEGSDAALKAVQSVLAGNPSKRLRAFVVWSAVSAGGTELRAVARSTVHDRRLVYFYDGEGFVANAFKNVVGSGQEPATDVLLLYDTDAHLAPEPPAPSMWMSANKDIKGTALDATQLGASTNELVRRVEEKVNDGAAPKK